MLDAHTPTDQPLPGSPVWQTLLALTQIAALLHDIGKANVQFQRKLRSASPMGERIRHELLSCLMFERWRESRAASGSHWIESLCDAPESLASMRLPSGDADVSPHWLAIFSSGASERSIELAASGYAKELLEGIEKAQSPGDVAGLAISWLVLTHHKAIDALFLDGSFRGAKTDNPADLKPFLSQLNAGLPHLADNVRLVDGNLPWTNPDWLDAIKNDGCSLRSLLAHPDVREAFSGLASGMADASVESMAHGARLRERLALNLAALARPMLILSDYAASAGKQASRHAKPRSSDQLAFANAVAVESSRGKSTSVLADPLPLHLLKARRMAQPFFLLGDSRGPALPSVDPASITALAPRSPASTPSKFRWQDQTVEAIAAIPDAALRPVFGVIVSETGSGKTIAGAKIMASLSGGAMRYTCGLGLRSLTLQTGRSYRDNVGLDDACTTMIGDSLYIPLQEALSKSPSPGSATSTACGEDLLGSESLEDFGEVVFDSSSPDRGILARALGVGDDIAGKLFSPKIRQLVETPIVVCTIDHLMRASILQRGSDARPLLRLMTADLLLDEIDNYSIEDLKALCRLAHVAGLYRRRVVLMSATVSSAIVEAIFRAWLDGLAAADFRLGAGAKPLLLMAHNAIPPSLVEETAPDKFALHIDGYFKAAAEFSSSKPSNLLGVVEASGSLADRFESIYQKALAMAEAHHVPVQLAGGPVRVSIGVARFNKVQQARQFARWLHEKSSQDVGVAVSLKIQCYHSHYPMMFLSSIENGLNRLLRRDPDPCKEAIRLASDPLIRAWLDEESTLPRENKMLLAIVCSTSIQETGRDHDYDFAIAEPRSTRSLVQMSGRVRRHRLASESSEPNIALLSEEFDTSHDSWVGLEVGRSPVPKAVFRGLKTFADFSSQKPLLSGSLAPLAEFNSIIGKNSANSGSLMFGFSEFSAEVVDRSSKRAAWLHSDFMIQGRGVQAAACLHWSHGEASALGKLEHFIQRLHFSLGSSDAGSPDVDKTRIKGNSLFPSALLSSGRANPYAIPLDWLWGRHASLVEFRRQPSSARTLAFLPQSINQRRSHFGLLELFIEGGSVSPTPVSWSADGAASNAFTCVKSPSRALINDHIHHLLDDTLERSEQARRHVEAHLEFLSNAGLSSAKGQSADLLAVAFSMAVHVGNARIYFDVILGADSQTSQIDSHP